MLTSFAVLKRVFLELVGLAGHGGLVGEDTRRLNDHTVDGDVHAGLDLAHITDYDVSNMNFLLFTVALDDDLFKSLMNKLP